MSSLFKSWLAMVASLYLVSLLPQLEVSGWQVLFIAATLLWLLNTLIWPVLKILLVPFGIISGGTIPSLIYLLLVWAALWLYPGITISRSDLFGGWGGSSLSYFIVILCIGLAHRLIYRLLSWHRV